MSSRIKETPVANPSRTLDQEREYIEGLLNDRFNYYLVFASLLLLATFGNNSLTDEVRAILLLAGALVSGLIAYTVGRTRHLLEVLLNRLRADESHPYGIAFRAVGEDHRFYRRNANDILLCVVWLLTALFIFGAAAMLIPGTATIRA